MTEYESYYYVIWKGRDFEIHSSMVLHDSRLFSSHKEAYEYGEMVKDAVSKMRNENKLENEKQTRA